MVACILFAMGTCLSPPNLDSSLQRIPLGTECWAPPMKVKLRDASKVICPIQAFSSISIKCVEEGAMDVMFMGSKTSTHEFGNITDETPGPLEYDEVCRVLK